MKDYNRYIINLFKQSFSDFVSTGEVDAEMLTDAQNKLSIELDRRKVGNLPFNELEALYEDIMWLKCDLLGYE